MNRKTKNSALKAWSFLTAASLLSAPLACSAQNSTKAAPQMQKTASAQTASKSSSPTDKSQPQQVHTRQAGIFKGYVEARKYRFVPDHHPMFVRTHLCSPHLKRPGQDHFMGMPDLRYANIGAVQKISRIPIPGRHTLDGLGLIGLTVGVFRQQ